MMYKFVKLKCGRTNLMHSWMLECNDALTLIEHNNKYMATEIEDGVHDVFTVENEYRHLRTDYGRGIQQLADIREQSLLDAAIGMESLITEGKVRVLNTHGHLLLRENGTYMLHNDTDTIVEEMLSDEMLYPNYTLEDIRVKQWQGGVHWYAHIGKLSVSMNGESKWNTQSYARQMAVEYFNTIIKNG